MTKSRALAHSDTEMEAGKWGRPSLSIRKTDWKVSKQTISDMEWLFGPLTITCAVGIGTLILLYWYTTWNHYYWKNKSIPYANPLPLLGSVWQTFKTPMHDVELQRYRQLGRVYGHFEGNNALLSVGDPELLRLIFVKDFSYFTSRRALVTGDNIVDSMLSVIKGEDWKRIRTVVSQTFSTGKIKRVLGIFKECSMTLIQNFKLTKEEGKPIEAKRLFGAFAMDVIASSAFSTKIDSHNDPDNQFVKTAKSVFNNAVNWRIIGYLLVPRVMKFFRVSVFATGVMDFFANVTRQIIAARKQTGQVRNDFLQLLLDATKELDEDKQLDIAIEEKSDIASNYATGDVDNQILKGVTSRHLSMDELVAQCVIFFLAGYDTSASTMSFATYLLAINPDVQAKVRKEVDEALKESKGELTYEAIQSMKYLDNIISETLRMYPPAIRAERVADSDYKLGNTGIVIPKGMLLTIPTYAIQRDPQHYPDPEKFDPDRFTPEERAKRDQYAYMPFGAGPRNCVAMRFALMEVKVCLAHVIANFNIKRTPETKVPLEFHMGQGLLQPKDIIVEMEERPENFLQK